MQTLKSFILWCSSREGQVRRVRRDGMFEHNGGDIKILIKFSRCTVFIRSIWDNRSVLLQRLEKWLSKKTSIDVTFVFSGPPSIYTARNVCLCVCGSHISLTVGQIGRSFRTWLDGVRPWFWGWKLIRNTSKSRIIISYITVICFFFGQWAQRRTAPFLQLHVTLWWKVG